MSANKKLLKQRKKVQSTFDWVDIYDVRLNGVMLKKGKKEEIIKGIKLHPHDIFLDSPQDQFQRINRLRQCYNKIGFPLYHAYVFNPVNIDEHIARLNLQLDFEEDDRVKQMLHDDLEKAELFIGSSRELEFFIMIKGKNDQQFQKNYVELIREFQRAGFLVHELNKLDYENYLANIFENRLINDFYFSRGEFSAFEHLVGQKGVEDD